MAKYKLLLPKMGESVAEATIIKWNKKPGDYIETDDTVIEIATDKVDSDVPSPVSGKLLEQLFNENDVVQVGSVIAIIETDEPEGLSPVIASVSTPVGDEVADNSEQALIGEIAESTAKTTTNNIESAKEINSEVPEVDTPVQEPWTTVTEKNKQPVFEEQRKNIPEPVPYMDQLEKANVPVSDTASASRFYSPLVKSIAAQEGIGNAELDEIPGTGVEGRLTKDDLLAYIQNKMLLQAASTETPVAVTAKDEKGSILTENSSAVDLNYVTPEPAIDEKELEPATTEQIEGGSSIELRTGAPEMSTGRASSEPELTEEEELKSPAFASEDEPEKPEIKEKDKKEESVFAEKSLGAGDEIIEMDRMRRLIADHMLMSKQTAPHVTSFVEADVTSLVQWREKTKGSFEKREGQKITYMPIFIEAVVKAIKDLPMINVSVNGTQIIKKKDINISMATALPSGNLIVPVIKKADELSLLGLTKAVNDLANRARINKLKPDDIQGGTFTITNIGSFGNIMGTPIINQPQVAILAVGVIKKKVAVIETSEGDLIGIRHMMYLSLSYDHRVVDGALGGSFVKRVADYLESWDIDRKV